MPDSSTHQPSPGARRFDRLLRPVFGLGYAAVLAIGLVAYASHDGSGVTPDFPVDDEAMARLRCAGAAGAKAVDVVSLRSGGRVRVSSYDLGPDRHPLYLIDGDTGLAGGRFWAPDTRDEAPWLELVPAAPADVATVRLGFDRSRPTPYVVRCLGPSGEDLRDPVRVDEPKRVAEAVHELDCAGAERVRVQFDKPERGHTPRLSEASLMGCLTAAGADEP